MRHDKLNRELDLLLMLTENHSYTATDICEALQLSRRNFYYYIDFLQQAGFLIDHHRPYYRIRKDSPFFRKISEAIHFTDDEAITIRRIIDQTGDQGLITQRIRRKLERLYDLEVLDSPHIQQQTAHNAATLYEAIKQQRMVAIKGYSSLHSNTVSDRIVEPFLFLDGNRDIRAYEPASAMNKTFRVSRMQDVVLLDLLWSHHDQHKQMHTDIFHYSSEQLFPLSLRMGRTATTMLREEYPAAERYISPDGSDHWLLNTQVCSFEGASRFVLGLYDDIRVLGGSDFRHHLQEKIARMHESLQRMPE